MNLELEMRLRRGGGNWFIRDRRLVKEIGDEKLEEYRISAFYSL